MVKKSDVNEIDAPFTVSSTRYCDSCKSDINIGLGGNSNWEQHLRGKAHLANERNTSKKPQKNLFTFFQKSKPRPSRDTAQDATPVKAPTAPSVLLSRGPLSKPTTVPPPPSTLPSVTASLPTLSDDEATRPPLNPLLVTLRRVIDTLPQDVPEGSASDALAAFSAPPAVDPDDDEGPFRAIDTALNRVIGFGASPESLKPLVRRGHFGMDGMFGYIKSCVEDIKIEPILLEGKIERLIEAMILCGATRSFELANPSPSLEPPDALSTRACSPSIELYDYHQPVVRVDLPSPAPAKPVVIRCPGYTLKLPQGASPYSSYPFMLHSVLTLPWTIAIRCTGIQLYSTQCTTNAHSTTKGKETDPLSCRPCARLGNNAVLKGIQDRLEDGSHENSSWAYLTPSETHVLLRRKTAQIKQLKLNALNKASTLSTRIRHLDAWKRMAVAIGKEDIPRIRSLMARETRAGSSIFTILERIDLAAQRKYSPHGYTQADFERAYLIFKLGGRAAGSIAQRTLGIPSIDATKRRIAAKPLQSSAGYPTKEELDANLAHCYPNSSPPASFNPSAPIIGMSMQIDEIKIQERLRWDPRSDCILGVCREHGHVCALEFRSMIQADALLHSLQQQEVHLATEATVVGTSILSGNPMDYTTRPFVISGSCKQENFQEHKRLLGDSMSSVHDTQRPFNRRLYCICTDGEARRRRSLIDLALCRTLEPMDPIYSSLARLPLFNLRCGPDNITPDFDWKHVFKRFRNTLLRVLGFTLNGIRITTSVLRAHLIAAGMKADEVDALLTPNDKQDVTLMLRLLVAISNIPPAKPTDQPTVQATRRVLCLLGRLYFYLLNAYLDVNISLHTQLAYLSAAAHIILAIYSRDKGNFIPVQTFFDVMSMIKNIYFCVAKTQRDDPNGIFYIILLGTDGLEKIFGKVRSMVGNDTNADLYQLTNRVDGATQCVIILEKHPEWGGQARRLDLKPLDANAGEITNKYDHLSPRSLKGDYRVNQVVLLGSWNEGRSLATQALEAAGIDAPFAFMQAQGGYDMFSPFGHGKMVLVETELQEGERHESEEERDMSTEVPSPATQSEASNNNDLQPDIDDVAGTAELELLGANPGANVEVPTPWVSLPNSTKPAHKASVLRLYSNPLSITSDSHDRLKRVRGYSRYDESTKADLDSLNSAEDNALCIQDPIVTLVRSEDRVFLAVGQVLAIRRDGNELRSISPALLSEPNIRLQVHIMKIEQIPHENSHLESSRADWEWTGGLEVRGILKDLPGRYVTQINPTYAPAKRGRTPGEDTYIFETSELRSLSAMLYERLRDELLHLSAVAVTPSFPYRNASSEACFICEDDTLNVDFRYSDKRPCCPFCPGVLISSFNGQNLLKHMGSHVLHDPHFDETQEPCGFCLNSGLLCKIFLKRNDMIDMQKSHCPYLRNIRIKQASTFSNSQPCSNHPLRCPLCPKDAVAIWKYNFKAHLLNAHPSANADNYQELWALHHHEKTLMRAVFEDRKRQRKSAQLSKKSRLMVSDAHSSRLALRDITSDQEADDDDNQGDPDYPPCEEFEASNDDLSGEDEEDNAAVNTTHHSEVLKDDLNNEGPSTSDASPDDAPVPALVTESNKDTSPTQGGLTENNSVEVAQASGSRAKRKRIVSLRFKEIYANSDSGSCASCERPVSDDKTVHCSSVGCILVYHLECQGLIEKPQAEWYCDDECKLTARGQAMSRKKPRRVGK